MLPQASARHKQLVTDCTPHVDGSGLLAGFAIDAPERGRSYPGHGIELTGWVIGRNGPVDSIVATVNEEVEVRSPLDIQRPDVWADYPDFSWAPRAGFSFWVPIPGDRTGWSIDLDAVYPDGARIPLAHLNGRNIDTEPQSIPGARLVSAPDYLILGTQRGGTTSLFRYLGMHPDVVNPGTKELHFLTDRHERGASWYLGQFPTSLGPGELTGEATPYALFHPRSPARAKNIAPNARFIVLLRDPVQRAYSHYRHECALGVEKLSFAEAIDQESTRISGESDRLELDESYVSFNHKHFSYVSRGNYAHQLENWLQQFPRDRFLILKSEDLYRTPGAIMQKVARFLELSEYEFGHLRPYNQSTIRDSAQDERVHTRLREHFAPGNTRLHGIVDWAEFWS